MRLLNELLRKQIVQTLIRHVFGGIASGSTLLAIMTTCGTDTKLNSVTPKYQNDVVHRLLSVTLFK